MDTPMSMAIEVGEGHPTWQMAILAVQKVYEVIPKATGLSAESLRGIFDEHQFGVAWDTPYLWFVENGTQAFTMNSLQGKVIPMWVPDPEYKLRNDNPTIPTKTLRDGRVRVLIFRRAAYKGERKNVVRNGQVVSVPRSWPGAPGRINRRREDGTIDIRNVGVRWRHPGLDQKDFIRTTLEDVASAYGTGGRRVLDVPVDKLAQVNLGGELVS